MHFQDTFNALLSSLPSMFWMRWMFLLNVRNVYFLGTKFNLRSSDWIITRFGLGYWWISEWIRSIVRVHFSSPSLGTERVTKVHLYLTDLDFNVIHQFGLVLHSMVLLLRIFMANWSKRRKELKFWKPRVIFYSLLLIYDSMDWKRKMRRWLENWNLPFGPSYVVSCFVSRFNFIAHCLR